MLNYYTIAIILGLTLFSIWPDSDDAQQPQQVVSNEMQRVCAPNATHLEQIRCNQLQQIHH